MTTTASLETPDATLVHDVRGPVPTADGPPPLLLVGAPMDASGFGTLAGHFPDRTVVTYDPRGLGRSTRHDGRAEHTPEQNAADLHRVIAALDAGPVELFATSGGAVSALALVAAHPGDVATLVAHEPPLLAMLPDAEQAFARPPGGGRRVARGPPAVRRLQRDHRLPPGRRRARVGPDPDRDRGRHRSEGLLTGRTSVATARALGQEATVFPGGHGGFLGGEFGQVGEPEASAARLREVLDRR